ncbi:efflux RND transporter periplasmic adaptor subunit [Methylogaea oryzae]|uniref:MexH family multidrug efflux RND transporter periplasmic adaptor subunit n=2 Tax=Methylogaea oryzae TaxID=1295382 RepID=A0A8D4VN80_9GAMM|nr:efflux RND transporter periplasmic adaptor subunit [Methylogaea oryzae]BBL69649.1 MexH family multidrug efflux RND transporter periplasmic adaptor subunit [Methylogaea oryzae]
MPARKHTYRFLAVIAVLTAASAVVAWRKATQEQPAAKPAAMAFPVKTAAPQHLPVADSAHAVGSFIADESAVVSAEIGGRVKSIHFTEGLSVKAGELLILLDPDEHQATAAQSRAQANLDKLNLGRTEEVRRRNLASQQALDEAQARWQQSQALAQRDQVRLGKTEIRAPFAGVTGLRLVSPGDYVTPGRPLVNVEALDTLKLDFALPEQYAGKVAPGQKITAKVDAYPGEEFAGELYAVNPRLDEQTRSVKLRGRFANTGRRLKPGMFARLTLALGADRQALFVPEHALIGIGSHQYVYRTEENKAVKTEVTTGQHRDSLVEITSGLAADSPVVVEGQMKLRDGATVRIAP